MTQKALIRDEQNTKNDLGQSEAGILGHFGTILTQQSTVSFGPLSSISHSQIQIRWRRGRSSATER